MTGEEKLLKAENDYPVGTVVHPAQVWSSKMRDKHFTITEDSHFELTVDGDVVSMIGDDMCSHDEHCGNCSDPRVVYMSTLDKWAEIRNR